MATERDPQDILANLFGDQKPKKGKAKKLPKEAQDEGAPPRDERGRFIARDSEPGDATKADTRDNGTTHSPREAWDSFQAAGDSQRHGGSWYGGLAKGAANTVANMVPGVGLVNMVSGLLGGPTIGGALRSYVDPAPAPVASSTRANVPATGTIPATAPTANAVGTAPPVGNVQTRSLAPPQERNVSLQPAAQPAAAAPAPASYASAQSMMDALGVPAASPELTAETFDAIHGAGVAPTPQGLDPYGFSGMQAPDMGMNVTPGFGPAIPNSAGSMWGLDPAEAAMPASYAPSPAPAPAYDPAFTGSTTPPFANDNTVPGSMPAFGGQNFNGMVGDRGLVLDQGEVDRISRMARAELDQLSYTEAQRLGISVDQAREMLAPHVVETVTNRAMAGYRGVTVDEVMEANKQFSPVNGPMTTRDLPAAGPWGRVVEGHLNGLAHGAPRQHPTVDHYRNPAVSSQISDAWAKRADVVGQYGTRNIGHTLYDAAWVDVPEDYNVSLSYITPEMEEAWQNPDIPSWASNEGFGLPGITGDLGARETAFDVSWSGDDLAAGMGANDYSWDNATQDAGWTEGWSFDGFDNQTGDQHSMGWGDMGGAPIGGGSWGDQGGSSGDGRGGWGGSDGWGGYGSSYDSSSLDGYSFDGGGFDFGGYSSGGYESPADTAANDNAQSDDSEGSYY